MKFRQTKTAVAVAVGLAGIVVGLAAPAAATQAKHMISGSTIKKHSISGNRLKNGTITGTQVNLNKLGTVPSAKAASVAAEALTLPALVWQPLTPENGWASWLNSAYGTPAYAVDAQGMVHLRGAISATSPTSATAFTVPAAIAPKHGVGLVDLVGDHNWGGFLQVTTGGSINAYDNGDHAGSAAIFTSLDGLEYYPGS